MSCSLAERYFSNGELKVQNAKLKTTTQSVKLVFGFELWF